MCHSEVKIRQMELIEYCMYSQTFEVSTRQNIKVFFIIGTLIIVTMMASMLVLRMIKNA